MIFDQYGRELEPIREPSLVQPHEANWKRVTKIIYTVVFMLVWICGVASFYFFGMAFKNGSPEPTTTQTEPLEDHGKIVYVTPTEKQRVHVLQLVSWVGFPVVLLGEAFLHFLVGVKLFPNTPTLDEYLNRGKNMPSAPTSIKPKDGTLHTGVFPCCVAAGLRFLAEARFFQAATLSDWPTESVYPTRSHIDSA